MARCICFEKRSFTILLRLCLLFVSLHYTEGDGDNEESTIVTHNGIKTEYKRTINGKEGELVNDTIGDADDESDSSATRDPHENLINRQSVDIVNTFNINEFGDEKHEDKNKNAENNPDKNMAKSVFTAMSNGSTVSANLTGLNNTINKNLNDTSNTSKPAIRWPCNPLSNTSLLKYMRKGNETIVIDASVVIVNNETTLGNVIAAMNRTKVCGLLLFYSPYCEFCTNLAPLYNAVGRSYRDLLVIASDAQNVMGISAKYGIVGIPTILLFHSGKAVAKYNRSRTVGDFKAFILQLTGVIPTIPFNITSEDNIGPLTSTLKESRDYYLIFSICFIVFLMLKTLGPCLKTSFIRCYQWLSVIFRHEKVE